MVLLHFRTSYFHFYLPSSYFHYLFFKLPIRSTVLVNARLWFVNKLDFDVCIIDILAWQQQSCGSGVDIDRDPVLVRSGMDPDLLLSASGRQNLSDPDLQHCFRFEEFSLFQTSIFSSGSVSNTIWIKKYHLYIVFIKNMRIHLGRVHSVRCSFHFSCQLNLFFLLSLVFLLRSWFVGIDFYYWRL